MYVLGNMFCCEFAVKLQQNTVILNLIRSKKMQVHSKTCCNFGGQDSGTNVARRAPDRLGKRPGPILNFVDLQYLCWQLLGIH